MPIYAYRCESCGHAKDVLQKVSDPVLSTCPACGASAFKKQLTAAGFQLKGSGWYVTDFKGGAASNAAPKTDTTTTPATPTDGASAPAAAPAAATSGSATSGSDTGSSGGGCGGPCS